MNQDEVLTEKRGVLGIVTLNRPRALNALSLEMIRQVSAILREWERDGKISAVLFLGAGEKAFCSGGDIKGFYRTGMEYRRGHVSLKTAAMFFDEEYRLDRQVFHYSKPTIAFMDGITMGGGYGIAGNCKYRVATDKTVFAMPEVGIGFFPDVGSVFHLLKAPRNLGRYLALTGMSVRGADMVFAKLAQYFVPSLKKEGIIGQLADAKDIKSVLDQFHEEPAAAPFFDRHAESIERLFAHKHVPKIIKALAEDGSPFALETLGLLESRSPTSVMVTAEHLRRSEGQDFDEVIALDFILSQRFLERTDFYEGIRAAVIDKDRNPQWNPRHFEEVSPESVMAHFEPTGHNLE